MLVVTGAAGFIGSCLVRRLNDEGIEKILIVDRLGSDLKWKNLVGKEFLDILSPEAFIEKLRLYRLEEPISTIVHLGACSTTTESDADFLYENNVHFSREIAEYALKNEVRFIYASSAATYGSGEEGYSDDNFNLRPLNMYGFSKHLFDRWVLREGHDSTFVGLKLFNVFGPNEYHKGDQASMVYKAFNQIRSEGRVRLFRSNSAEYADGGQMRDFVYVKDVVDVIRDIIANEDVAGIYNLGTGKARSWNDLANAVFRAMGREPAIEYVEMPPNIAGQYQNFTEARMEKLSSGPAARQFRTLEDSVTDYVRNHLMNNNSYM
jgi:ADP-L-glycero-D-manno-heptose 6-epimerase